MQAVLEQPLVARAGEVRAYQGGYFRVLVAPGQTNNDFALLEFTLPRGAEPPRHLHTREDETFYVLQGEMSFHIGDEVSLAKAGDSAWAPRQVPHHYHILSPQVRLLSLITPGSFSGFFMGQSAPLATPCPLTPPAGPPSPEAIRRLTRHLWEEYGVQFGE